MVTEYVERAPTAHVVLDIGEDIGALIVHTDASQHGREIEASPQGHDWLRTHTEVLERRFNGQAVFAAVFAALPAGEYVIWRNDVSGDAAAIAGGAVTELCLPLPDPPHAASPPARQTATKTFLTQ